MPGGGGPDGPPPSLRTAPLFRRVHRSPTAVSKRLIVGLGNPGPEYENTRHNVGFLVADAVAGTVGADLRKERDQARSGWVRWRGHEVGIAKPWTYMNRSGTSVEALLRRASLKPTDMLVVVDDIHLPLGRLRARPGGGAGGHNGLQDIIDWLDTDAFPRLRIGIGREFGEGRQADYVLSPFDEEEREAVAGALDRAVKAALTFVTDGIQVVMNRFNG